MEHSISNIQNNPSNTTVFIEQLDTLCNYSWPSLGWHAIFKRWYNMIHINSSFRFYSGRIPYVHNYYNDAIVKLYWSVGRWVTGIFFMTFYQMYIFMLNYLKPMGKITGQIWLNAKIVLLRWSCIWINMGRGRQTWL